MNLEDYYLNHFMSLFIEFSNWVNLKLRDYLKWWIIEKKDIWIKMNFFKC